MKLHNLAVIFIVIAIPLILVTAYYISLQIDTINMQTAYNTKLLDSTKEAIDAFEINTVQWNANYSETADSKRRDVMASINTFINSFANNIGVGGTSKEYIMAYMPAIAYTLYDGYYIYSPANEKVALTDDNGVGIVMTKEFYNNNSGIFKSGFVWEDSYEGKLLYVAGEGKSSIGTYTKNIDGTNTNIPFTLKQEDADTEYDHILKPFALYSESIGDFVINYTLDNYITIYGMIDDGTGTEEYVYKAGYLTKAGKIGGIINNSIKDITFDGSKMEPEYLSEKVAYKDNDGDMTTGVFYYAYESEGNTKVYFDEYDDSFIINSSSERIYLKDNKINRYKKVTIPQNISGWSYIELYQNLNNSDKKWYYKNSDGEFIEKTSVTTFDGLDFNGDIKLDYSAINYCVESFVITNFVNKLCDDGELKITDTDCKCGYDCGKNPLCIKDENDPEEIDSAFSIHKRGIIKNVVESNLNQAITSYSRNSAGEYKLPKLTETDWDQILENVSIITFIQNIPIGLKYYNNYAIATSTVNKEYVDPDEIYLNASDEDDEYYHLPYCTHLGTSNLIGYRSIDYVQRSYTVKEIDEDKTKYYYKHTENPDSINVEQACYYCLVQRSLYNENKADNSDKATAYNTALARERYIARMSRLPAKVPSIVYLHGVAESAFGTPYIYLKKDESEIEGNGIVTNEIKQDDRGKTIEIYGKTDLAGSAPDTKDPITTTLISPADTVKDMGSGMPGKASSYTTSDSIKVTIFNYDSDGVDVKFYGINGAPDYGVGSSPYDYNNNNFIPSDVGTGYINVKLHYTRNYEIGDGAKATAWANIDKNNILTIATRTQNITGKIRLKFTNGTTTYYSENIFDIENGDTIYCQIKEDKEWYKENWRVTVLTTEGTDTGVGGEVEYYTVYNEVGLRGFSEATNEGAKTKNRIFYLIGDLDLNDEAPVNPICQSGSNWFDGYFGSGTYHVDEGYVEKGGLHSISNIEIKVENEENYAYGLFGWVGKLATIENLTIEGIKVQYTGGGEDIKTGGLAGMADIGNSINNVTVKNAEIQGTTYIGGIVGISQKLIENCTVEGSATKLTTWISESKRYKIYIGGILGKEGISVALEEANAARPEEEKITYESDARIINCEVLGSAVIGSGGIIMDESSKEVTILGRTYGGIGQYILGGIVGETSKEIEDPIVEKSVKVYGGKISYEVGSPDPKAMTCAGGIVGYKENTQNIDSSWKTSCTVEGYDNVGGIVGYNCGGSITGITDCKATIMGGGENIGGIVGLNTGSGEITNCTNTSTVTASEGGSNYGENVGGIVGLNNAKDIKNCIKNCTNNGSVTGDRNVGGIVGLSYTGTIESCANKNTITAKKNSVIGDSFDWNDFNTWYNMVGENATGSGGIAGKIYKTKIEQTYNEGTIQCNYNGGGLVGVAAGGYINFCYNGGSVKTTTTNRANRLGGICGSGHALEIEGCYNLGNIIGTTSWSNDPLASGVGGIIGFLADDGSYTEIKTYSLKYIELDIEVLGLNSYHNKISYCYNAGKIQGHYIGAEANDPNSFWGKLEDTFKNVFKNINVFEVDFSKLKSLMWYNGAIVGYVGINVDLDFNDSPLSHTTFTHNYYLQGSSESGGGRNGRTRMEEYQPLEENAFKEKLYKWANSLKPKDNYIYNTTAPVEEDKGYKGYGILWWQLNDYVKLTSDMFMCSREEGKEDSYINFPNANYNQTIHINDTNINFKNVGFDSCRIVSAFEQPVKSSGCYRWIMMIKKGTYNIKGKTDFSEKSILFVNNRKQIPEKVEYSVNIQNNTQLHIAPIITFISAELKTENIKVVWDRINIDVEAESKLISDIYDANHNKINKVNGYYELDPNDSKATIKNGEKSISVYLDKYDEIQGKQPIRFYRFEYYTKDLVTPSFLPWTWYYEYNGPNVIDEGTKAGDFLKGRAEQASCSIYINVQNLVDLLGKDTAKNYILHTAQVNMDYNINMWFDAGDFGSLWTNAFNSKDSKLLWNISIQKYSDGEWKEIQDIPYGKSKKVTNSDNNEVSGFNKDGYYSVFYGVDSEDISASLKDVKSDDELRIVIHVEFKSKSAHSYFNVDKAKLDITYGPNISF